MAQIARRSFAFYSGVFLISFLVMSMQILQSRIFSVTTWYHLSFLVISVAMFGLTLGALRVYNGDEQQQRRDFAPLCQKTAIYCGISIFFALLIQLYYPIVSANFFVTLLILPLVAIPTAIPYYFAGIIVTLCLTRSPYPVGRTYGIDLLGAGLGCIGALLLMETIDTPSALIFLCALAGVTSLAFLPLSEDKTITMRLFKYTVPARKAAYSLMAIAAVFTLVNVLSPVKIFTPLFVKGQIQTQGYDYEEWNSISRVIVKKQQQEEEPFFWGASPNVPSFGDVGFKRLKIDGDAETPITSFDGKDFSKHQYLEYDVTNIAYRLPNLKKTAIIGIGGGRDALSAKYFGVEDVSAIDVNPVQIKLLKQNPRYTSYTNLSGLPGMHFINSEARSWFRSTDDKFDLIQMSLIDTWAATGAGAFALSENGLYTKQAWQTFIDSLSDHGVFTVSRWSAAAQNDTGRILSLAVGTLLDRGVQNPREHLIMTDAGNVVNLMVSKNLLAPEQVSVIRRTANEKAFEVVLSPDMPEVQGLLGEILNAKSNAELIEISDRQEFDMSPPTDMRPFFFNQARFSKPLDVIKNSFFAQKTNSGVFLGQVKATFNLFVIIFFSLMMVAFVILKPLAKTLKGARKDFVIAGSSYFLLIGLGFMLLEISLLQALGVFLGHPIYGLGVVLFSLIISAGVGSLVSDRFPLSGNVTRTLWALATFAYAVGLSFFLDDVFSIYARTDLTIRALISVAIILPAGLLMGYGFPTGIRLIQAIDTRATAWFWGINGAAGVLGSSIGIALNISIGIDKTLIIGALCYALLSVSMFLLNKQKNT